MHGSHYVVAADEDARGLGCPGGICTPAHVFRAKKSTQGHRQFVIGLGDFEIAQKNFPKPDPSRRSAKLINEFRQSYAGSSPHEYPLHDFALIVLDDALNKVGDRQKSSFKMIEDALTFASEHEIVIRADLEKLPPVFSLSALFNPHHSLSGPASSHGCLLGRVLLPSRSFCHRLFPGQHSRYQLRSLSLQSTLHTGMHGYRIILHDGPESGWYLCGTFVYRAQFWNPVAY